ncbi:MAG: cytochrome c [Ectothiorhodospiraceae bacterium]|nr:cytochrome c [Ectothiorhodospiraceae bacterium]
MMRSTTLLCAAAALSLGATTVLAAGAGDAMAGKEKAAQCVACHGPDGNSPSPQFPKLAGQHADYIVRALTDYATGARKNAIMAGFAANLTERDRADLAAWFASQSGDLHTVGHPGR